MPPIEMTLRPDVRAYRPPDDPSLPLARPREVRTLKDGDTLALEAGMVRRSLAGRSYTMFGFNGQYPGPLLVVGQRARDHGASSATGSISPRRCTGTASGSTTGSTAFPG